jgi:hypothetical protein
VTIAIHTPDSDEADKNQDKLEEDMMKNFNSGSAGDESALKDIDVEKLRLKVRDIYHEVRSLYSESMVA